MASIHLIVEFYMSVGELSAIRRVTVFPSSVNLRVPVIREETPQRSLRALEIARHRGTLYPLEIGPHLLKSSLAKRLVP